MQQDILINWSPQETRVAVVEQGAVQELHVERTLERGLVGNVYLGKVARVLPGMQSAFIDIGLERAAFLHVADVWHRQPEGEPPQVARSTQPLIPIEKQVFEGQALMVQVIKDPIGTKGARLSTQISIAGRHLVFLPQDDHIGVSQKIPTEQRDALRQRLQSLVGDQGGGFILRTNAEDSTDAELGEDIAYLRKTWARIKEASIKLPAQSLLHQDLTLLQRVLRDLVSEATQTIRLDSKEQFEALVKFAKEFMPASSARLQLYKGERPIFDLYAIDEEVAKALGRRVDLKSGATSSLIKQRHSPPSTSTRVAMWVRAILTTPFSKPIWKRRMRLRANFDCAIWGASSLSISLTCHAMNIRQQSLRNLKNNWPATVSKPWQVSFRNWACWK